MLMRRRKTGALYRARLNPRLHIGCQNDPLLEIHCGAHWTGLLPPQMVRCFEILAATPREVNQLALLTEYPLRYARDFTVRLRSIHWIGQRKSPSSVEQIEIRSTQ